MTYAIRQFPFDDQLEKNLNALLRQPAWAGWRVKSSFVPPVTNGNILVYFVLEHD